MGIYRFMLMRFKQLLSRRSVWAILLTIALIVAFIVLANLSVLGSGEKFIYLDSDRLPKAQVGLILGAKVYSDGRLSHMMQDRADTAIELYKNGKVEKLLMSGDHGTVGYDEVNTVKEYLLNKGVRAEDLFLDHAGFDTYDSVYRARDVFRVKSMTIVTQRFHLPRAVYLARALGVEANGMVADKRQYLGMFWNESREIVARSKAFLDIITGAKPKFLGEEIPIDGDSRLSWD